MFMESISSIKLQQPIKKEKTYELPTDFISEFKGKEPNWGTLGKITAKRTYCRYIESEDRLEEWWEVLKRVVEGEFTVLLQHYINEGVSYNLGEFDKEAKETYQRMWEFKFLPPGRGLWMMGTNYIKERGGMALNNCAFVSTGIEKDFSFAFVWAMDALMQGMGVGFDITGKKRVTIQHPKQTFNFEIPDSREGWCQGLKHLLDSYFTGSSFPIFSYTSIRKRGTQIKGFGGVSSGYEPLEELYINITNLLNTKIGEEIDGITIVDIFNYIAKCVIAGNVRRSALISLGRYDDESYLSLKEDQEKMMDRRWASNISVSAVKGINYDPIIKHLIKNGEPGIIWMDNIRTYFRMDGEANFKDSNVAGVNPCGEMALEHCEMCNLVELFPARHETLEDLKQTAIYAYKFAKIVTLMKTPYPETNRIMKKNRRIGISQTGIIQAFEKFGRRRVLKACDDIYDRLLDEDEVFSEKLGINKSIKLTTVKPSGTVSLLAGATSGIHYPHSEYYIRRIRFASNDPLVEDLRRANYNVYYDPNSITAHKTYTTVCVDFPVKEDNFSMKKSDVSIWEQIANVIDYQRYWADNQVSVTVTFKKEEIPQIKPLLEFVEDKIKGITFLPLNDHGYMNPPYEEITEVQYNQMVSRLKPLEIKTKQREADGEKYCTSDKCLI